MQGKCKHCKEEKGLSFYGICSHCRREIVKKSHDALRNERDTAIDILKTIIRKQQKYESIHFDLAKASSLIIDIEAREKFESQYSPKSN